MRATKVAAMMTYWNVWKNAPRSICFPFVVYDVELWYLSSIPMGTSPAPTRKHFVSSFKGVKLRI
jgi:hypothetical protein